MQLFKSRPMYHARCGLKGSFTYRNAGRQIESDRTCEIIVFLPVRASLMNTSMEEEVVSLHATLTFWNATSVLFAAALGAGRCPPFLRRHLYVHASVDSRETSAMHTVKISSSTNQGESFGGCADVGCFESTGDQAEEIYMNQDGRRDPALTLSALCLDRNILWFALLMLFRVST